MDSTGGDQTLLVAGVSPTSLLPFRPGVWQLRIPVCDFTQLTARGLSKRIAFIGGMALNAAFGWWWADPVAALGMTYFLVREGREAWKGVDTCRGCADEDRLKESANQVRSLTYDFYEAKPRRSRERAA